MACGYDNSVDYSMDFLFNFYIIIILNFYSHVVFYIHISLSGSPGSLSAICRGRRALYYCADLSSKTNYSTVKRAPKT